MADVPPCTAPAPPGATEVCGVRRRRTCGEPRRKAKRSASCASTRPRDCQEIIDRPPRRQLLPPPSRRHRQCGANDEDVGAATPCARLPGAAKSSTSRRNYRASQGLCRSMANGRRSDFRRRHARADRLVRTKAADIAVAHRRRQFDLDTLQRMARRWPGLEGMDLAEEVRRCRSSGGPGQMGVGQGYEVGLPSLAVRENPCTTSPTERPQVNATCFSWSSLWSCAVAQAVSDNWTLRTITIFLTSSPPRTSRTDRSCPAAPGSPRGDIAR